MRTSILGIVGSLVALVGFASTASAIATIDLLWNGVSSNATIATSSSISLHVVYSNDTLTTGIVSVSIDYSDANGKYSVVAIVNNPNGVGLDFLPLSILTPLDDGSAVKNLNAQSLSPYIGSGLAEGQSYLLGTIMFHKDNGSPGGPFSVQTFLGPNDEIGVDGVALCRPDDVAKCTLGSATLNNVVPEPGTVSLLALSLAGLSLASRRKN